MVNELATLDRLMSYLELARDAGFTSGDVERLARREIPEALVIVGRVAPDVVRPALLAALSC